MRRSIATPATRGQGLEPTQEIPNGFPDAGPVVALAARPATALGGASAVARDRLQRTMESVALRGSVLLRWLGRSLGVLIAVAVGTTLAPSDGEAVPGFARQTGLSCQACHTIFPELTPFGRQFKLNAYVFTNVKQLAPVSEQAQRTLALSEIPPVAIQLQGSNTMLARALPDSGLTKELSQKNSTEF